MDDEPDEAPNIRIRILEILHLHMANNPEFSQKITKLLANREDLEISEFFKENADKILEYKENIFSPFIHDGKIEKLIETGDLTTINLNLFCRVLIEKSKQILLPSNIKYANSNETFSKKSFEIPFEISKFVPQVKNEIIPPIEEYTISPMEGEKREIAKAKRKEAKRNRKPKKDKTPPPVKEMCMFLTPSKYVVAGQYAGSPCGKVILGEEKVCREHSEYEEQNFEEWTVSRWHCTFVISQAQGKDRARCRKGLPCLNICKQGSNRCNQHKKVLDKTVVNNSRVMRSFKVRLKLSNKQKHRYNVLAGCVRKTKNLILEKEAGSNKSEVELRKLYVNSKPVIAMGKSFLLQCPKASRDAAVTEHVIERDNLKKFNEKVIEKNRLKMLAYEENVARARKRGKKIPEKPHLSSLGTLRFAERNGPQSLTIDKQSVTIRPNGFEIFKRLKCFGSDSLIKVIGRVIKWDKKFKELQTKGIQCDLKMCKTPSGKFYMHIPYWAEKDNKVKPEKKKA